MKTNATKTQNDTGIDLDFEFSGLVRKFDRLSDRGKQKMIDAFDDIDIRERIENADAPDVVKKVIDEMKNFLQKKLEES